MDDTGLDEGAHVELGHCATDTGELRLGAIGDDGGREQSVPGSVGGYDGGGKTEGSKNKGSRDACGDLVAQAQLDGALWERGYAIHRI